VTIEERVKRAGTPREALLILARALDELQVAARVDPWQNWDDGWEYTSLDDDSTAAPPNDDIGPDGLTAQQRANHTAAMLAMSNTTARDIVIPKPSEEKMEQRRMLERQQLKLGLALGVEEDSDVDWTETYAKAGPWWLWQERRDLVMGYDYAIRQAMVKDVEEDRPDLAYEMGLDVLKQPAGEPDLENGSGALAVSNLTASKVKHG